MPDGEAKPLYTDVLDQTTGTPIEAKGTVERGAIRMTIGQVRAQVRMAGLCA